MDPLKLIFIVRCQIEYHHLKIHKTPTNLHFNQIINFEYNYDIVLPIYIYYNMTCILSLLLSHLSIKPYTLDITFN